MSYNIVAVSSNRIDWTSLHESVRNFNNSLEYIPMPKSERIKNDSLGLSIPSSKINNKTWSEVEKVLNILFNNFNMKIYEMYSGKEVTKGNLNIIKDNLFSD
jgi:hypothetical protein